MQEILNAKAEDDPLYPEEKIRVQRMIDKYRDTILGKTCFKDAPDEYHEIGLACELGYTLEGWYSMSLDYRAQTMARAYLKNMVSTIDRHYDEMDERIKKMQEDSNSKKDK